MALYDDGGVEFAQQQFAEARKRKEEQAKKQDKFSRNLLYAKTLVNGVDSYLNKRANDLQTQGVFDRATYLDVNNNAQEWKKMYDEYSDLNYTNQQMLEEETFRLLSNYTQQQYGEEYDISAYNDGLRKIAKDWAADKNNLEAWENALNASLEIPALSNEELLKYIKTDADKAPRSIASWFGNSIKKVFNSHSEDTLTQTDSVAKKALLGGVIGQRYDNVKAAIGEYGAQGNPISELTKWLKSDDAKALTAYKNDEVIRVPFARLASNGSVEKGVTLITQATIKTDVGNKTAILDRHDIVTETAPSSPITQETINNLNPQVLGIVTATGNDQYMEIYRDAQENNSLAGVVSNVELIKRQLADQYTDLSESELIDKATKYVFHQMNTGQIIDFKPIKYDIDKALSPNGQLSPEQYANFQSYIDDVLKVKKQDGIFDLKRIRNDQASLIAYAKESNMLTEEEANEQLIQLNQFFEDIPGLVPATFENIHKIETANLSEEEKSFLQSVNDIPVIGSVSEFMLGDKFGDEVTDYLAFIPGFGLAKVGFKGVAMGGNLAFQGIAKQVLSKNSKRMEELLKRYQKGFKNKNNEDTFVKSLSKIDRAIYNSISKNGKSVDITTFAKQLSEIPGTFVKGFFGGRPYLYGGGTVMYGAAQAYTVSQRPKEKEEEKEDFNFISDFRE